MASQGPYLIFYSFSVSSASLGPIELGEIRWVRMGMDRGHRDR